MSNFARIDNGFVIEVIQWDPAGRYPEDWQWEPCPVETKVNSTWDGTAFTNTVKVERAEPAPVPLSLIYPRFIALVRQAGGLTAEVALSIVNGTHPSAEVLFLRALLLEATGPLERDDPLIQGGLDMLVAESVITQSGRDTIVSAWPVE